MRKLLKVQDSESPENHTGPFQDHLRIFYMEHVQRSRRTLVPLKQIVSVQRSTKPLMREPQIRADLEEPRFA